MYIQSEDYQTIWNLGHNWTGHDPVMTDPNNLPKDLQVSIQRMLAAIFRNHLPARSAKLAILMDDSIFTVIVDFRHIYRIFRCIHNDTFDKTYLNSIYVKRANVLNWCKEEYLDPPPIWKLMENSLSSRELNEEISEEEDEGWYSDLSERRKKCVACLELAKKLWLINPEQTYEEIYNDPTMKRFGNPNVFSLASFKKWSRQFAPEFAKKGGRRSKNM